MHSAILVRSAVVALVGLALEARIASGPNVVVLCHNQGQDPATVIKNAIRTGCRGIISFGIAGGLAPGLRPGDLIVASAVTDQRKTWITDAAWSARMLQTIPGSTYSPILGIDAPVAHPSAKLELYRTTEAAAVDMESHVVARLAGSYDLAFTALRIIIDPVHRLIPDAALASFEWQWKHSVWRPPSRSCGQPHSDDGTRTPWLRFSDRSQSIGTGSSSPRLRLLLLGIAITALTQFYFIEPGDTAGYCCRSRRNQISGPRSDE